MNTNEAITKAEKQPITLTERGRKIRNYGAAALAAAGLAVGVHALKGGPEYTDGELANLPQAKVQVEANEGANSVISSVNPETVEENAAQTAEIREYVEEQHEGPLYPNETVQVPVIPGENPIAPAIVDPADIPASNGGGISVTPGASTEQPKPENGGGISAQ